MKKCCIGSRNILHAIQIRKFKWFGHILSINCLLIKFIEGKVEGRMDVTRRRGKRRKQLLDDLKKKTGYMI
jgi:hypothetical protein